jgi:protein ImuA
MIEELRQRLRGLERPPGLADGPAVVPLGPAEVDAVLGGGLMRGALHEIAASGEAHMAAATGFAVGVASLVIPGRERSLPTRNPETGSEHASGFRVRRDAPPRNDGFLLWVAEDMSTVESGAPYGAGLDDFGMAPERLVTVAVAQRRDLLWAMEEALHCRAIACVVGEMRHGPLDAVAARRLSLAAADTGALALLLRAAPEDDASTAATRWVVSAPPPGGGRSPRISAPGGGESFLKFTPSRLASLGDPPPPGEGERARFTAALVRNRRGPRGQWILEWRNGDGRFTLAAHAQPVAQPPVHRPHQKVA